MAHIEIHGEALCKCGIRFTISDSNLPSKRVCSCGLKSTIQQCASCRDIIIIYESAEHKIVTCGNCGRTIQGKLGDDAADEKIVGGADEIEHSSSVSRSRPQPIGLSPPYDPYANRHTHRRIIAESVSGPIYSGQKKSTCWGGNKKR